MRSPELASVCRADATDDHDAWMAQPWRVYVDGRAWVGATDGVHALLERHPEVDVPAGGGSGVDCQIPLIPHDCRALVPSWFALRDRMTPTATADVGRADKLRTQLGSRLDAQLELDCARRVRLRAVGLRAKPMLRIADATLLDGIVDWDGPAHSQSVFLSLLARAMGWVCSRSIPLVELRQAQPLTAILVSTPATASQRFAVVMPARW